MRRYGLRDDQWDRIKDLLPGREGHVGATAKDNRLFVEAVLYRYRAGIPWRDLPERFGDWKQVHTRHTRWATSGVWERVFKVLAADADNEYAMIDRPSCGPTSTAPARAKKRRRRGDRAQSRGTEHQDPRSGRCLGQPDGVPADSRPSPRSGGRRLLSAADQGRRPAGRQGLRRRQAGDRTVAGRRHYPSDPVHAGPQHPARLRP